MRLRLAGLLLVGVIAWAGCSDDRSEASSRAACKMFRALVVDSNEDVNFADEALERVHAINAVAKTADDADVRAAARDLAARIAEALKDKKYDPGGPQPATRFKAACNAIGR